MANYGNSFGPKTYPSVGLERINVWDRTLEFFPGGALLKASDTYPVGTVIPAGTPVSIEKPGGEAKIGSEAVPDDPETMFGLTYQDVTMGTEACTLTIVARGTLLVSRVAATITSAQKTALNGRITFVKEA